MFKSNDHPRELRDLIGLLEAGMSLPSALATMLDESPHSPMTPVLSVWATRIAEGSAFSRALAQTAMPATLVVAMKAGEQAGDLIGPLRRYCSYVERREAVAAAVRGALAYPAMIIVVGAAVSAFILFFLVPRLSVVYAASQREVPLVSRLLFGFGVWVQGHQPALLAVLCVLAVGLALAWRTGRLAAAMVLIRLALRPETTKFTTSFREGILARLSLVRI